MRSTSAPYFVLLCVLVLSLRTGAESSSNSSSTSPAEEEDEESLAQITLAEFKERYRRLIPYMTFYVASNYVNGQTPVPQTSAKEYQSNASPRKEPEPFARLAAVRKANVRLNEQSHDRKFVPSLQYDPRQLGNDNEYFAPVRYTAKISQDDYPVQYQTYQRQKSAYPDATPIPNQFARKDHRYYTNVRPPRPYATNGRDPSPRKQLAKPSSGVANVRDEYALNYNVRPIANGVHYPGKEFQGVQEKQPGSQLIRNPNVNLDQIVESLHLSERLPEILSRDNIDNSLRTLAEILNILHNKKKEEFPQVQQGPMISLIKPPSRLKVSNAKRPLTRPKVITETRFQATPNPLYLTDDPERYKVMSYEEEIGPPPPQSAYFEDVLNNQKPEPDFMRDQLNKPEPAYVGNSLNNKLLEYYIPVVQDAPIKNKEVFLPTVRPPVNHQLPGERPNENSYEITENLNEDVLQQDQYPPPPPPSPPPSTATTETSVYSYTESNKISPPKLSVPQTSVKYGATQGKAHVDYPAYSSIPLTNFSCKEQRYKGFFGDPETGCQVWHYCDLNGGKSSFLCPNGTVFSQVALTCDWWFNVKCETTTQLYVLNERLYKYILPVMPKFPEDFTGPEVDRYLELKFKEMEAKLKEKLKKEKEEKEKLKDKPEAKKESEEEE
ncbi:uncharacterized protein LOC143212511 [Lasioglossum baleicum]|uniref:uncharacterized protein LOC143212511 n=1 Tax=Lasioglossum baleicum TaxID=434251 RepID=UPI003FCC31CB